jgi:hypothetical protein
VVGGVLLWVFGRHANHIGASGLVFGLVAFLIVSGLLEPRIIPLFVSFTVGVFYGGHTALGRATHGRFRSLLGRPPLRCRGRRSGRLVPRQGVQAEGGCERVRCDGLL